MNKHLCADSVSKIAKRRPEQKSKGGLEEFLQGDSIYVYSIVMNCLSLTFGQPGRYVMKKIADCEL